jgi:hypothetical protein
MKLIHNAPQTWLAYACTTGVDLSCTAVNQTHEQVIIDLSAQGLTPGYHHLACRSFTEGRELMLQLIAALDLYKHPAFISAQVAYNQNEVVDLYYHMLSGNWLANYATTTDFFAHHFIYDFVWIELDAALIHTTWFSLLENALCDFQIAKTVPIFVLTQTQPPPVAVARC